MIQEAEKMRAVIRGLATVSDQIRALNRAGYQRADIARFLGKRYQHVRNVLVADEQTAHKPVPAAERPPVAADSSPDDLARSIKVRVGAGGEVVVPAPFRESLGIRDGDVLFARIEDGEVHLLTPGAAMRRAQAMVRQFVPEGVSLVDELIGDRRREVEREAKRG